MNFVLWFVWVVVFLVVVGIFYKDVSGLGLFWNAVLQKVSNIVFLMQWESVWEESFVEIKKDPVNRQLWTLIFF